MTADCDFDTTVRHARSLRRGGAFEESTSCASSFLASPRATAKSAPDAKILHEHSPRVTR